MIVRQKAKGKRQKYKSKFKILLLFTFALHFYLFTFTFCLSYAETLSSNDLIEKAKELEGKSVTYKGELVTAILNRGEYSWINLNDGYNAIGIWCKTSELKQVKSTGDYKNKGDILEIEGVFNRACPLHGGELDIHAEYVKVVKSGYPTKETIGRKKIGISAALFLIILCIVAIFRKRI